MINKTTPAENGNYLTAQLKELIRNSGILIQHNERVPVDIRQRLKVHKSKYLDVFF